ncbi:hypothetical protein PG985_001651 [Apiospora marii]|uniref:uncharacterized protein n=1 Tax=Apiospora marii TaxID=335849 RepID=UPI00312E295B
MSPVVPVGDRASISNLTLSNSTPANATLPPWEVICAWPVSGQYGPGSRYLYYALVAACILARKSEWLRNACLAAGLLFPAIAAFHGIVLAAMHNNGAVDMDVYGAFQLCTIGILAAPVTVRWSKTYFYDPARNLIFLWTALIFAGLLSLTVEFYRLEPIECTQDGDGNVISPATNPAFPYETPNVCRNIPCSVDDGPWSSLRQGSTNEIFIIPAPQRLTFGAATLLAAACCIPAILSMVSMWNKILEINWKRLFGHKRNHGSNRISDEEQQQARNQEVIEGTNGATVGGMKNVNEMIRQFLSVVQIPVFVGAVLTIMVIGELNFWSESVNYQTEPVTSIGQWAPIVGTVLAALGSLYVLGMNPPPQTQSQPGIVGGHLDDTIHRHDNISQHGLDNRQNTVILDGAHANASPRNSRESPSAHRLEHDSPIPRMTDSPEMVEVRPIMSAQSTSPDLHRYMSNGGGSEDEEARSTDAGGRRKVAQIFGDLGRYMGTPAPDLFDDSEFRRGRAMDFPEIPGEAVRNPDLEQIRSQYNQPHDSDEEGTPLALARSRSRAGSFVGVAVDYDAMGISTTISRSASPSRVQSLSRSRSRPPPSPGTATRSSTMPVGRTSKSDSQPQSPSTGIRDTRPRRRETLEVPSPVRPHATAWSNSTPTTAAPQSGTSTEETPTSEPCPPTIVISPDPEIASSASSRPPTLEPSKPNRDPAG